MPDKNTKNEQITGITKSHQDDEDLKQVDEITLKPNHCYLLSFTLIYAFATTIQSGFLLGENGPVSFVFSAKFGWNEDGTALTKNMFITNLGILGIALGAIFGSKIIQVSKSKNISLIKLLCLVDFIGIIANSFKLIQIYPVILVSRFFQGLCGGTSQVLQSKFISETVPVETLQIYGQGINSSFCLGIALTQTLGLLILPAADASEEELLNDQNWRIVYAAPIVVCQTVPLILITIFFKHPSMRELLESENKGQESDELIKFVKQIYVINSDEELKQALSKVWKEQQINGGKEQEEGALDQVTLLQGLKSKTYRFGIMNANLLCMFAQTTGISVFVLFSTQMFIQMKEQGKFNASITIASQIMIWVNWLATFYSSIPVKMFGQKKTLFTGYCAMTLALFGVVICQTLDQSVGSVILLAFIIFAFQGSAGPITFIHAQETIVDSAVGMANLTLFIFIMATSWLGPFISDSFNSTSMFTMFAVLTLIATVYIYFVVQDTTFVYDNTDPTSPQKRWMTLEEKKLVYTPQSLAKVKSVVDTPEVDVAPISGQQVEVKNVEKEMIIVNSQ